MHEDIEAVGALGRRIVIVRERQQVRLRRSINARVKTTHPTLRHPGGGPVGELARTVGTSGQRLLRIAHRCAAAARVEPLIIFQGPAHGVQKYFDVGNASEGWRRSILLLERNDLRIQRVRRCLQRACVFRCHTRAKRRKLRRRSRRRVLSTAKRRGGKRGNDHKCVDAQTGHGVRIISAASSGQLPVASCQLPVASEVRRSGN